MNNKDIYSEDIYTFVSQLTDEFAKIGYKPDNEYEEAIIGVINSDLQFIIPVEYEGIEWNSQLRIFTVWREGEDGEPTGDYDKVWQLYDAEGNQLFIGSEYDTLMSFESYGMYIVVGKNEMYGKMDINGRLITPLIYSDLEIEQFV